MAVRMTREERREVYASGRGDPEARAEGVWRAQESRYVEAMRAVPGSVLRAAFCEASTTFSAYGFEAVREALIAALRGEARAGEPAPWCPAVGERVRYEGRPLGTVVGLEGYVAFVDRDDGLKVGDSGPGGLWMVGVSRLERVTEPPAPWRPAVGERVQMLCYEGRPLGTVVGFDDPEGEVAFIDFDGRGPGGSGPGGSWRERTSRLGRLLWPKPCSAPPPVWRECPRVFGEGDAYRPPPGRCGS